MRVEVRQNLDNDDLQKVLHLLASSFPLEYAAGWEFFKSFLERCPDKCYLLVRDNENSILGISCILSKKLYYDGLILDVAGLSYSAVLSGHRNFMVSAKLKEGLFSYVSANSDLSLGFARKALDNYWYPYGFLGFTNFGSLLIEIKGIPSPSPFLKLSALENNDIEAAMLLFDKTYTRHHNLMIRTVEDWKYILDKLLKQGLSLYSIKTFDGAFVGYVHRSGYIIEEICIDDRFMGQVLNLICSVVKDEHPSAKEINFQIGLTHPLSKYIRKHLHHSIHTRFAWKGGHIIRVSNILAFLLKTTEVIESRLLSSNVREFSFECCGLYFNYNGHRLYVEAMRTIDITENEQRHFWQKLIFGVQDAQYCLYESEANRKILPFLQIMFPERHPQIPVLDQF